MISIVSATRCSAEQFEARPLAKSLRKLDSSNIPYEKKIYFNNNESLAKCYNDALLTLSDSESIIFCHDDILIEDMFLFDKLEDAFKLYDVVGLAGTTSWKLQSPCVWNNSARETWRGAVTHSHRDKVWNTAFGEMPARCLLIDGLFIAINRKKIIDSGIKFDENICKWNFYDLDFCLQGYEKKILIGVYPIAVRHYSIGDWRNSDDWKLGEKNFISKWQKGK